MSDNRKTLGIAAAMILVCALIVGIGVYNGNARQDEKTGHNPRENITISGNDISGNDISGSDITKEEPVLKELPDFTGWQLDDVAVWLAEYNFGLNTTYERHDDMEDGIILFQSTTNPEELDQGTFLDVVVNIGPVYGVEIPQVPDVIGFDINTAVVALSNSFFDAELKQVDNEAYEPGIIYAMEVDGEYMETYDETKAKDYEGSVIILYYSAPGSVSENTEEISEE